MNRAAYLDMRGAAVELNTLHCKDPLEAARLRIKRAGIPTSKIGNTLYVLKVSLEEARKREAEKAKKKARAKFRLMVSA